MERHIEPLQDSPLAITSYCGQNVIQQDTQEAEQLHQSIPRENDSPLANPTAIYTALSTEQRVKRRQQIKHNRRMAVARLIRLNTTAAASFVTARKNQDIT